MAGRTIIYQIKRVVDDFKVLPYVKNVLGVDIMVQWVELPFGMPASHVKTLVQELATLLPIQLPANTLRKAVDDCASAWIPVTLGGEPDGVFGSRFQPSPALAIMGI